MQGFPPRLPGSTVIRDRQSMTPDYGRRTGNVNLARDVYRRRAGLAAGWVAVWTALSNRIDTRV